MKKQIINEIKKHLSGDNIENASKRLLDFFWYYLRDTPIYQEVIELRKNYNLEKTLGQKEVELQKATKYKDDISSILESINIENGEEVPKDRADLVLIDNITKTFNHRSKKFEFGPVSLDIHKGDIVGVVGENGNGKTTFLRILQEEISKDSGQIKHFYKLENISSSDHYKRKNRTAFIPQRVERWRGTLMENLVYFAAIHGFKGKENSQIVNYVIHRMGLSAFTGLTWGQLSSGYKLRFELTKMLIWEPDILILDEPLANLDIQATQNLLEDLRFFADSTIHPIGILLTSQQLHEVEQIADKILFLRNGKSIFSGSRESFTDSREERVVELMSSSSFDVINGILKQKSVRVTLSSNMIKLHIPWETNINEVLQDLINANVEINYFRDITNSTVQLFNN